jgi:dTDP-4-amino-4,6-dideoxygalactose transaminase
MTSSANETERSGYTPWDMVVMGWKYNMHNKQAEILIPQLERMAANMAHRGALDARYIELLH